MHNIPVITVDGPSGAGKGTLSAMLANWLDYTFLDSGAIYRVLGLATQHHDIDPSDEDAVVPLAASLDVEFSCHDQHFSIVLEGEDVSQDIRNESIGAIASQVAALPRVREALLRRQRAFVQGKGLVADGRDMGTVVFPEACAKIYLTASAEARAKRRMQQLNGKQDSDTLSRLLSEIKARDERDSSRKVAPLLAAEDALTIDSTSLSVEEVFEKAKEFVKSALSAIEQK